MLITLVVMMVKAVTIDPLHYYTTHNSNKLLILIMMIMGFG